MMRLTLAAAAVVGLAGRAFAQDAAPAGLNDLRAAYVGAYNAGRADAMAALYVPDAVRMPYDAEMQEGRDAILETYRTTFARRRLRPTLTLTVDQLEVRGDLVVERGRYREVLRLIGEGRTLLEVGKYVSVARRGNDGAWRYAISIFNRDAPAAPLPPTDSDRDR